MRQYLTSSSFETKQLSKTLAQNFSHGVIGLSGELGSGKTTFVQGFAQGLGIKEKIISPTFVLIRSHQIPQSKKVFYHVDLYRLEDNQDLKSLGLEELIKNKNNIILIEWAEKAKNLLPKKYLEVLFKISGQNKRLIKIF